MEWQEVRVALIMKNKSVKWLCKKLGYSRTYLYRVFEIKHKEQIKRIKKILEEV